MTENESLDQFKKDRDTDRSAVIQPTVEKVFESWKGTPNEEHIPTSDDSDDSEDAD